MLLLIPWLLSDLLVQLLQWLPLHRLHLSLRLIPLDLSLRLIPLGPWLLLDPSLLVDQLLSLQHHQLVLVPPH